MPGNEKYIYGPYEKGIIYECSWFDSRMNGCSARFQAIVREGRIVFKELDGSRVHDRDEFFYIGKADDQYPHIRTGLGQIED